MKKLLSFLPVLLAVFGFSQVRHTGIHTTVPKATLEVTHDADDNAKGILIPRITGSELVTMTPGLGEDQDAMIMYLKDSLSTQQKESNIRLRNVYYKGFYTFDNGQNRWKRLEPTGLEHLYDDYHYGYDGGWRLITRHPENYGTLGIGALDLAITNEDFTSSSTIGATGENSVAIGAEAKASGRGSFSFSGDAQGGSSVAFPTTTAMNYHEVAMGSYNYPLFENNADNDRRPIFSLGNGINSQLTRNAFVVLRNANTGIGIPKDESVLENNKPTEMLDVNGNIRVRGRSDQTITVGTSCTNKGTITFYNDNFYGCKSTGWVLLNN